MKAKKCFASQPVVRKRERAPPVSHPIRKRKGDKIALTKVRNTGSKNAQQILKERRKPIIEHIELF